MKSKTHVTESVRLGYSQDMRFEEEAEKQAFFVACVFTPSLTGELVLHQKWREATFLELGSCCDRHSDRLKHFKKIGRYQCEEDGEGNWSNVLAMLCHSLRCSTLPSNQISNSKYATGEPWQEKDIRRETSIVESERGEELLMRWRG